MLLSRYGMFEDLPHDEIPPDDNIYRVFIDNSIGLVNMLCVGIDSVDNPQNGNYSSVLKLPKWVQERIAILTMCPLDKPTPTIQGVGRRINADTFWVFK